MSKPELFFHLYSPPARATYLVAKELEIDFIERKVNLYEGETTNETFRGMNVTGTVPTWRERDLSVFDSHAINIYLVEKYGKNDSLYPKNDINLRTKINQILFYEASYLFPLLYNIAVLIYFKSEKISQENISKVERGYGCIESFLKGIDYVAGNQMTLADFSIWSFMEIMIKLVNCDEGKYPRIAKYLGKIRGKYPEYNRIFVENIAGHMKFFESCFEKPMENFLTKGEQ